MKQWPNPQLRKKLERQMVSLARSILSGTISLTGGAQQMRQLHLQLALPPNEPAVLAFSRICDATRDLPVGDVRQYWDEAAMRSKDVEIAQVESWAGQFGADACRLIIEKFGHVESTEGPI